MPFKQIFERRLNAELQGEEQSQSQQAADVKKDSSTSPEVGIEEEDADFSEKKDRPPRFSTIFGVAPPLPQREFESYPQPNRKSGIWMPTALFVLLVIILLFESTLLFAYTVIGLYNNLPSRLVSPTAAACNCETNKQPGINIAPNFMLPQAAITQTVTVLRGGVLPDSLPILPTASVTTASSTFTAEASSQAAAVASDVLSMFNTFTSSTTTTTSSSTSSTTTTPIPGIATSTEILSEVAPPQSTVNSIKLVTVDASGSTLPSRPTVTSTMVIDASQAAAASSSAAASIAAESSVSEAMASLSAALTPDPIPSSTTFATSTTPSSTPPTTAAPQPTSVVAAASTTTSTTKSKNCLGAMGRMGDVCL